MKKILSVLIISLFLISFLGVSTSAEGNISVPYYTYEYNNFDEAVEAPAGYYPSHILDSSRLSLDKSFKEITDLTYYNGLIYILDSQNGRIVSLDKNYNFVKEYSNIRVGDRDRDRLIEIIGGETVNFIGATGLAISKSGKFYIADKLNNRILCVNQDFILESVIVRPDEALNDTDAAFSPSKIAVDDKNRLYVISSDIALGIMIFNANGEFMQFFGANEVLSTTQAFVKAFRKLFMSVAQLELVEQATPVTIRNMDFSNDGFIYTVSPYRESSKSATPGLLKKLNYKGEDVLNASVFGDLEEDNGDKTRFADIDIDNKGFINLLDENRGRVFQYTDSGMLITIFGSKGDQVGCLTTPVAIESVNEDILVADKEKNCIFVYSPTEYVKTVRSAVLKINVNDLDGSIEECNNLVKMNSNSYFAYEALGRIYDYKGDYPTAMKYFKLAYDQDNYALAYKQHRQQIIEKHSILILVSVLILISGIILGVKKLKKLSRPQAGSAYSKLEQRYTMPIYVLTHPIDGCAQFKIRNITSMIFSAGIILAWVIIKVIEYDFTGFAFSINRSVDFNMPVQLVLTVGVFVAFVISNWFISVLFEGKGTIKDIIAIVSYSLIPYLVSQLIKIVLTNFLVPSESVFITIVTTIGLIWTIVVMFLGLMTIHEYSVGKTVFSILLTFVGIIIIVFIVILLYSLLQQLTNFISSVYREIIFRM